MRTSFLFSFASLLALGGCGHDAVGQCVSRCEQAKADGCLMSEVDCEAPCAEADEFYGRYLDQAEDAGCASEFEARAACYYSTPACANAGEIAEMCAEEEDALESCW